MKYLKLFDSKSEGPLESLKDALSELRDEYIVYFTLRDYDPHTKIEIVVELQNHFPYGLDGNLFKLAEMDNFMKSFEEKSKIAKLIDEGLERSQIEYTDVKFTLSYEVELDESEGDYSEGNFLVFTINIGEKSLDKISRRAKRRAHTQ
jgi:hypothetical protein